MPLSLTILLAGIVAAAGAEARPRDQQFRLRAQVLDMVIISSPYITALPRDCIQVDFDARFAVRMRVVSIKPPFSNFRKGRTVTFAMHSPTMLFATPTPVGKTYDFTLRTPQSADSHLWSLHVRWPNHAMQPTASPRTASLLHD